MWEAIVGSYLRLRLYQSGIFLGCYKSGGRNELVYRALTILLASYDTECSSMARRITTNACIRLLNMTTFHSFRSFISNPPVFIRRICFSTVLFPDSPAPGRVCKHVLVQEQSSSTFYLTTKSSPPSAASSYHLVIASRFPDSSSHPGHPVSHLPCRSTCYRG
jgi:hypothetical protein